MVMSNQPHMSGTTPIITADIDGEIATRLDVEHWERRRATAVLTKFTRRLGAHAISELLPGTSAESLRTVDLPAQRAALVALKSGLGHAGIYAMLRRELAISERTARLAVAASRGRTRHSVIRLTATDCSAIEFATWFNNLTTTNSEADMISACPDHYLLRGLADGRQEVVETTGGSPTATRFLVDYTRTEQVSVPADPDYPVQIVGQAVLDDGLAIGGVRHQFRDTADSMEALLTVEFPGVFPHSLITAHCWHLATEFSNWIIASQRSGRALRRREGAHATDGERD